MVSMSLLQLKEAQLERRHTRRFSTFTCFVVTMMFGIGIVGTASSSNREYVRIVAQSHIRVGNDKYLSYIVDSPNGERINVEWVLPTDRFEPRPTIKLGKVYAVEMELNPDGYSVRDYRENWISKLISIFY